MDEEKLIRLVQEDPNFIKKLSEFKKSSDLAEFLRSNGVNCEESEANKILCTLEYFQIHGKTLKIPDEDLNVTGGIMGVSNKLLNCFLSAINSFGK